MISRTMVTEVVILCASLIQFAICDMEASFVVAPTVDPRLQDVSKSISHSFALGMLLTENCIKFKSKLFTGLPEHSYDLARLSLKPSFSILLRYSII
jgi:hypothetical protein